MTTKKTNAPPTPRPPTTAHRHGNYINLLKIQKNMKSAKFPKVGNTVIQYLVRIGPLPPGSYHTTSTRKKYINLLKKVKNNKNHNFQNSVIR